ncbi:MAG: ABC transporter ATP-binding protein [Firmicutes bacterium]|nr:ABC transporter ATP-binding protein [Bacillota bacterium]
MPTQPVKIPVQKYYKLLATYLRPHRRQVLLLAGCIFGSIGSQLANPQIMRFFLDTAIKGGSLKVLLWAAFAFIGAAVIQGVFSIAATYLGENLGWTATNALRKDLLAHCLDLDLSFHKLHTPGEMIERIGEDVNALANFFSQFTIRVLGNVLIIVGVLVLLYLENVWVGLAITLFVMITLATILYLRGRSLPSQRAARQASAELSGYIEERLSGTEDIKANGAAPYVMRGFFKFQRDRNDKQLYANTRAARIRMAAVGLHYTGIILALIFGVILVRNEQSSIGTVYLFILYTDLIFRPVMQITRQMEDFQHADAGIQRIQELFHLHTVIPDGNGPPLPPGPLKLQLERVGFSYDGDDEKVLNDISFDLQAGETLGLLGRTGSGKTTITRLLTRLYDYHSGSIRIGGIELKDTKMADLRQRVGLVTQDVQLFHASVRDNVTFFNNAIPDRRIEAVFEELGLGRWLKSLPNGLNTILTGGKGLSAGEAQLLALSRVFLRDPGLVIMDEASSRLDPASEKLLETAMNRLLSGRTGIIVAHRLSTILKVDKILILENGAVLEYGYREQLLRDPRSVFNRLLKMGLEEVMV